MAAAKWVGSVLDSAGNTIFSLHCLGCCEPQDDGASASAHMSQPANSFRRYDLDMSFMCQANSCVNNAWQLHAVQNMSKLWRKEILNLVQTDLRAKSVTFPPKSLTNSVNYFIFLGQAPLPVVLGAAGA